VPRKGQVTPRAAIGDALDGDSLYHHLLRYLRHLSEKHYSPRTVASRETYLCIDLAGWLYVPSSSMSLPDALWAGV
jgi:hypothetical protein